MTSPRTAAFVGAVGGAGTTRLCLEAGAALAAAGRDVLLLDLDVDTQGLARHVDDDIPTDATTLLTDPDTVIADATYDYPLDTPGRLALVPAHAPFVRVADAKAPDTARRLDRVLGDALATFEYVLLDTPPVASNPAVAGVTAADRVALVFSPDSRGTDATARERGRLADVGATADTLVTVRTSTDAAPPDADVAFPSIDAPVGIAASAGTAASAAAGRLVDHVLDTRLEPRAGTRLGALRRKLP